MLRRGRWKAAEYRIVHQDVLLLPILQSCAPADPRAMFNALRSPYVPSRYVTRLVSLQHERLHVWKVYRSRRCAFWEWRTKELILFTLGTIGACEVQA